MVAGYGVRLGGAQERAGVRAYCSLRVQPRTSAGVIRELGRFVEVEEVSAVSGQYDYLVFLRCDSHEQLDGLLDRIGLIDGVEQTQTSIVLSRKLDRRNAASV